MINCKLCKQWIEPYIMQGVLIKPTQKLADSLLIRSALRWWVGGRNDRLVADFICMALNKLHTLGEKYITANPFSHNYTLATRILGP